MLSIPISRLQVTKKRISFLHIMCVEFDKLALKHVIYFPGRLIIVIDVCFSSIYSKFYLRRGPTKLAHSTNLEHITSLRSHFDRMHAIFIVNDKCFSTYSKLQPSRMPKIDSYRISVECVSIHSSSTCKFLIAVDQLFDWSVTKHAKNHVWQVPSCFMTRPSVRKILRVIIFTSIVDR